MSEERNSRRPSLINNFIGLLVNTIFLLLLSLFVSIVVEWLGLYFHWWEGGVNHSINMLRVELTYANDTISSGLVNDSAEGWVANSIVFYKMIMHHFFYWSTQPLYYMSNNSALITTYADAGYNISMVFALRILLIIFSFPLFFMVFIWGFVDGLVERDLRKFGAGRESSTIFEAARRISFPLLVLPFILYLSFPISINPLYIIPPSAFFQAILYRMLFSKYKKYL